MGERFQFLCIFHRVCKKVNLGQNLAKISLLLKDALDTFKDTLACMFVNFAIYSAI